jgi:hypothetical protein
VALPLAPLQHPNFTDLHRAVGQRSLVVPLSVANRQLQVDWQLFVTARETVFDAVGLLLLTPAKASSVPSILAFSPSFS